MDTDIDAKISRMVIFTLATILCTAACRATAKAFPNPRISFQRDLYRAAANSPKIRLSKPKRKYLVHFSVV